MSLGMKILAAVGAITLYFLVTLGVPFFVIEDTDDYCWIMIIAYVAASSAAIPLILLNLLK